MLGSVGGEPLIDGSRGEGGGQILRTAMSLAAITGRPLRIESSGPAGSSLALPPST